MMPDRPIAKNEKLFIVLEKVILFFIASSFRTTLLNRAWDFWIRFADFEAHLMDMFLQPEWKTWTELMRKTSLDEVCFVYTVTFMK